MAPRVYNPLTNVPSNITETNVPFEFRYSQFAKHMKPSPIRELFKVINQPGMISFAGGLPDPAIFPVDEFAASAGVLQRDGKVALQYGASEGYGPLIDVVQRMMTAKFGRAIDPSELLITTGSQQAADLVARALLDPGDVVVVEAPTYPGTLHSLRNAGARFLCIPCDGDGMRVDLLRDAVAMCERETGRRPKLIYTIPDFSNPTGACLSLERRREMLRLAEELSIPIFEDDPYSQLRYLGEPIPSIKSIAGESPAVLYVSSFSKILAPGVRLAWSMGDPGLIRSMVLLRQGEDLCTPSVTQALVAEYCAQGHLDRHLEKIVGHYRAKRDAMQRAMEAHLPSAKVSWHEPQGGFFVWVELADGGCNELFDRAIAEKVAFLPGDAFYPSADEQIGRAYSGDRAIRLCFTFATEEQMDTGCRRLASVLGG